MASVWRDKRLSSRRGVTLLELAVSIGVIALLMALILPAVQAARESARRVQCSNNLKQIGVGLQAYAAMHGCFPSINAPTWSVHGEPLISAHKYSPLTRMLPQLAEQQLFDLVNFSFPAVDAIALVVNHTAMVQSRSLFLCPSDPGGGVPGYGRANYRFSLGPTPNAPPDPKDPLTSNGAFVVHRFLSPREFTRGLSNVVGVSERIQGDWNDGQLTHGDYRESSTSNYSGDADATIAFCEQTVADAAFESRCGESWFLGGYHFTSYNHVATPNHRTRDCSIHRADETLHGRSLGEGMFTARSFHGGGVLAMRMDASVDFVADAVDLAVWRRSSMRRDL